MDRINYYLHKNNKTGEIVYFEYNKMNGYSVAPKKNISDAIKINKIVFINPSFSEKLIRKKIDVKLRYLLRELEDIDDSSDEGSIRKSLMDAERLKLDILNKYIKYLGNTYGSLTIKKVQVIINQLFTHPYYESFESIMLNDPTFYMLMISK